jgi:Pretoxin HINT domain
VLFVQGPNYNVMRTYPTAETRMLRDPSGFMPPAPQPMYDSRVMRVRRQQSSDLSAIIGQILSESRGTVLNASLHVEQVNQHNARIIRVLASTTEKNLGPDRQVWRKWWAEEQGYTYDPPPPRPRQDWTLSDAKPTFAWEVRVFAAGTPVHTLLGLRAIESIQVGDQVLTQDPRSGLLSYQPVVATVVSRPDKVLKIDLSEEEITATDIDRFWKVGQGWVMARGLEPGDRLRSVGGVSPIKSVEEARSEQVFNLTVMQGQSFFVGKQGMLVHDNSLVEPVDQPFDAVPDLAAIVDRPASEPRSISP